MELTVLSSLGIENKEICKECGGACCQRFPGAAWPRDFGSSSMQILFHLYGALSSGHYAVDWWEGKVIDEQEAKKISYFIRPATQDKVGRIQDPTYGGICYFWSKRKGCALEFADRPTACRMLAPVKSHECNAPMHGKKDAAIAWLSLNWVIEEVLYALGEKSHIANCNMPTLEELLAR